MKAVTIDKFGGVEEMHWSELPTPQPLSNEVQIQIEYTSINPVDWKIRDGSLQKIFNYEFPIIPGWDAAGVVTAVGENVSKFKIGDEVFCYCKKSIVQWGTYAQYVCVDATHVAFKPKKLDFSQAGAIPLVGLTAWQALFEQSNLRKGQSILIHAGAGGVGSLAIQIAKIAGATVYTTAGKKNHSYVKRLGADHVIDYNAEDFVEYVKKRAPSGLDVVLDCVGYETLARSFDVVKSEGHLVSIVNNVDQKKAKEKNIHGSFMIVRPDGVQLEKIALLFDEKKMVAPYITAFPLEEYAKAMKLSEEGHTKGKIVLYVTKEEEGSA